MIPIGPNTNADTGGLLVGVTVTSTADAAAIRDKLVQALNSEGIDALADSAVIPALATGDNQHATALRIWVGVKPIKQ
jgi:hypothetical protein